MQVIAMYLFPLLIGIAVSDNVYGDWTLGYFGHVAELVGGPGLAVAVTVAAAVSQVGMFEAEMSSDSYQVRASAMVHSGAAWCAACCSVPAQEASIAARRPAAACLCW
jgi:hypothetical protein